MHAVVVRVTVHDEGMGRRGLEEQVIPRIKQAPGFVAGYWTRSAGGNDGLSMVVFESEDTARAASEQLRSAGPPDGVELESVELREVVAHA